LPALVAGYLPVLVTVGLGWQHALALLRAGSESVPIDWSNMSVPLPGSSFGWPSAASFKERSIELMKLWIWAVPALVLLASVGFWRHRRDVHFRLMLASLVVTAVGLLFVSAGEGYGWGARQLQSAWFVIPIVAAAAATAQPNVRIPDSLGRVALIVRYARGAAVASLLLMVPYYLGQVHTFNQAHRAQVPEHGSDARVVILNPYSGYYVEDLVQNDPFLRNTPILMVSKGRKNDAAMMAHNFPELVALSRRHNGTVWGPPRDAQKTRPQLALGP
jgi:hypothetical protein